MTLVVAILFVLFVCAALLGRSVRRYLPQDHLSTESGDAVLVAQSIPSISKPMLIILVFWLAVIFFGFSLIAPPTPRPRLP